MLILWSDLGFPYQPLFRTQLIGARRFTKFAKSLAQGQTNNLKETEIRTNKQASSHDVNTNKENAPTAALDIIHDLIPLELALQETALNSYHRLQLMAQARWTNRRVKNHSLIPHLGFLKKLDQLSTGCRLDTKTMSDSIESKNCWVSINRNLGRAKPIPPQKNV